MMGRTSKRHRGGTGEAVHRADHERTKRLIRFQAAEVAIEFRRRHGALVMAMSALFVAVGMAVHVIAVFVRVLMDRPVVTMVFGDDFHRAKGRSQIQRPEQDQHQGDAEFQTQSQTRGHDDAEENDGAADDEEREAVADAPKNSGPGRAPRCSVAG